MHPWTRRFGAPAGCGVVLVCGSEAAIDGAIDRAFFGEEVHIVCRGALSPWNERRFQRGRKLTVTELEAYLPSDRTVLSVASRQAFDRFIDHVFDGALTVPHEMIGASAALRLGFDALMQWEAIVAGVRAVHGDAFELLDPPFQDVAPPTPLALARAMSETLALRLWERVRSRKIRARLKQSAKGEPRTWIGVIGDWPRSSRHALEAARGEVGILLQEALRPGHRQGAHASDVRASDPLPALRGLEELPLAQCVEAERLWPLIVPWLRDAWRAYKRLTASPYLQRSRSLSLLLTRDLLKALESAQATRELLTRRKIERVFWSHCSGVSDATADRLLREAGAVTTELFHGALAPHFEAIGAARVATSEQIVWTKVEEALERRLLPPARGGFVMRRCVVPSPRRSRVLLLTNYATAMLDVPTARPRRGYQAMLVRDVASLPLDVVWRPHPGDDQALVRMDAERWDLPLCEHATLEDALGDCDMVIASVSTAIVEAALALRPVVVHAIPAYERAWLERVFGPERLFRDAQELQAALTWARAAPVESLRDRLFAGTMPQALAAALM